LSACPGRDLGPPLRVWSFGSYALISVMLAVALAALTVATASWSPSTDDLLGGLLLAAGFALARHVAIEVDLRRDSIRVTLTEIPLVVGLALLPGPLVILAFATVVAVAGVLRRDAPAKLAVNVSLAAASAATAVLVVVLIDRFLPVAPDWFTILFGASVGHAVGMTMGVFGLLLLPGAHRRMGATVRLGLNLYVVGVFNAVAGVAAVEVLTGVSWGAVLVALLVVVLTILYRAYYGLLHEQRDLELLNQVSLEVAGAGRSADGTHDEPALRAGGDLTTALELSRDQLNATRVVLHRRLPDGRFDTVVAGLPLPQRLTQRDVATTLHVRTDDGGDGVRRLERPGHADALDARGATEVLLAPLHGAEQLVGLVEVHDRQSRFRGFGEADLRLIATLASHLTTALDNRRLLAQLRHDAYHDTLTDLRNRLGFREAAAEVLRGGDSARWWSSTSACCPGSTTRSGTSGVTASSSRRGSGCWRRCPRT